MANIKKFAVNPITKTETQATIIPKKPFAPKTANELLYYGYHTVRAIFKARSEDIIRVYCTEERLNEVGDILTRVFNP